MISFDPLRAYMEKHGKSVYHLTRDKVIGGATLDKIRADSPGVTLDTIDKICRYLGCRPRDVFSYTPGDK